MRFPNPAGIRSLAHVVSAGLVGTVWVIVLVVAAAFVALVRRYRAGDRELREQIKWVALTAAMAVLCNVIALLALLGCGCDNSPIANGVLTAEGLAETTESRRAQLRPSRQQHTRWPRFASVTIP